VQSIKSDCAFESIFEEQEDFDERARAGVAVGHALGEPSWMKRKRIQSRKLTSLLDERSALLNGANS
jgi:hypothetical protein